MAAPRFSIVRHRTAPDSQNSSADVYIKFDGSTGVWPKQPSDGTFRFLQMDRQADDRRPGQLDAYSFFLPNIGVINDLFIWYKFEVKNGQTVPTNWKMEWLEFLIPVGEFGYNKRRFKPTNVLFDRDNQILHLTPEAGLDGVKLTDGELEELVAQLENQSATISESDFKKSLENQLTY